MITIGIIRHARRSASCLSVRKLVTTSGNNTKTEGENPPQNITEKYDIVINGGGIVGFSLLAGLNSNPYMRDKKILLIEQQPYVPIKSNPVAASERKLSNRVSSVTSASKLFLETIGVWNSIDPDVIKKSTGMYVWSEDYKRGIHFSPRFSGLSDVICRNSSNQMRGQNDDAVCYFIENHLLLQAIQKAIPENQVFYSTKVSEIKPYENMVDVTIDKSGHQETIRTNLLIGCDGFNSVVRRKSNLKYFEHEWDEKGVVGTIEIQKDSLYDLNSISFQRFVPSDDTPVVALLPLTENYSSFVVSAKHSAADHLMSLSDEDFVEELNHLLSGSFKSSSNVLNTMRSTFNSLDQLIKPYLGLLQPSEPPKLNVPQVLSVVPNSRAAFPLVFGTTIPNMIGSPIGSDNNKIVIIGDSCHRIMPLAGQGLNLGIGDAIQLSESLSEPLERGVNLFSGHPEDDESLLNTLKDFERKRQLKLIPMMVSVASMQKMFQFMPTPLISMFNHLDLIKNEIVTFANAK